MSEHLEAPEISGSGEKIDDVVLDIDYQIIEHFSRYLYGSASKAVEELVTNGFDAYAEEVYVYLPGPFASEHVAVWDDGWSMDVSGLKGLWQIAASPKLKEGRVAQGPRGTRKMIGKFGIGKLASYAIGNTITHLCRHKEEFLAVSIDYRSVNPEKGQQPVTTKNPLRAPIRRLTEADAKKFVAQVFPSQHEPAAMKLFPKESWTLAVIGALKGKALLPGRLAWILGNGMPLRPDFHVWVDDQQVAPKLESEAVTVWEFDAQPLIDALSSSWERAKHRGDVEGEVTSGREAGLDPSKPTALIPFLETPNLGKVWGTIRLFDRSLIEGRPSEHGRSHGFFIIVLGRLLNPDDPEFLLSPPSFGTFYRSQFIVNVDGLDEDLLADRGRLQQDTARYAELSLLQQSLYIAARTALDNRDEKAIEDEKHLAILPTGSREFYREPLTALLMRRGLSNAVSFEISHPKVERKPLGDKYSLATIAPDGEGFLINVSHPYYQSLEERIGTTKRSQEFYRVYDLFAIGEQLLEGYLYDLGLDTDMVDHIMKWRDGLFRELAQAYKEAPSDLAIEVTNSSYVGGKRFEIALTSLLSAMGFKAERLGASGKEDVSIVATIGPNSYSFIFEAKGSKNKIENDSAEVSGAASHRDEVSADYAVVVAREFTGFSSTRKDTKPAILRECEATGGVSIMTTDALIKIADVVHEFGYPLDVIKDVFTTIESPTEKLERIRRLGSPAEDFNYKLLLETIWEAQNNEAKGDVVSYRPIWQAHWKNSMTIDDFEQKIVALETLAAGRIRVILNAREVYILQSPEIVLEAMDKSLQGRGSGHWNPNQARV